MQNKTGYGIETDIEDRKMSNSVPIYEQETHVSYMRDEDFAIIYTSDTTEITRFNRLCKESPEMYSEIANTGRGKTYRCENKDMVSFRKKKREISEEQKLAAGERMRKYQASKNN